MGDNFLKIRGSCGADIGLVRDEQSGQVYTVEPCANSTLMVGSATTTVRLTCKDCPDEIKRAHNASAQKELVENYNKENVAIGADGSQLIPGTPVVAAGGIGVVQGMVVGRLSEEGTIPVQYPGVENMYPVQEKPKDLQTDGPPSLPPPQPAQSTEERRSLSNVYRSIQQPCEIPIPINVPPPVQQQGSEISQQQHERCNVQRDAVTGAEVATCSCGTEHLAVGRCPTEMDEAFNKAQSRLEATLPINVPPPKMQVQVQASASAPASASASAPASAPSNVYVAQQQCQIKNERREASPSVQLIQHPAGPEVVTPIVASSDESRSVTPTFLPGMNLSGLEDQSVVDVDAVLSCIPGLEGGPSTGGISWSTISHFKLCQRRAYYGTVLGLKKSGRSRALDIGTLVHACFELHYRSGGMRTFEPCDAVHAAGGVDIAADARRYVYAAIQKWGEEEALTWDVRGIELQGTWFQNPVKICGKRVMIPWTCRHDLCVALRDPWAACCAPGEPVSTGVYIADHKTAHALTYELTKGYGMDGQFKLNALIYRRAEAAQYGPLAGVIVSIIAKHKRMTPDSLFREYTTADEASVNDFFENELRADGIRYYEMLADEAVKNDPRRWPKNHAACVGRYGCCPYFDICDTPPGGEEAIIAACYRQDPTWMKDVRDFIEPPPEVRRTAGKTAEQLSNEQASRDAKKEQRARIKDGLVEVLKTTFGQYEQFQARTYVKDGVDKKTVKADLTKALESAWEVGTHFSLNADNGLVLNITITAKGISWNTDGMRGTLGWGSIAGEFVKDWWDLQKNAPQPSFDDEQLF